MQKNKIQAIIIGDEILSGKRQDKHFKKILELCKFYDYQLNQVIYVSDEPEEISKAIANFTNKTLFCFGGIGATPDDHTRQSAAIAYQKKLVVHPEALSLIENKFGKEAYPKRVLMSYFPEGAEIIPNPINQIPGFYVGVHFFMPGFPEMAWPMMEWIFNNKLPKIKSDLDDQSIVIKNIAESFLIDLMNDIESQFPLVKMYSLPKITPHRQVEFGVKGDKMQVQQSMSIIKKYIKELGYDF